MFKDNIIFHHGANALAPNAVNASSRGSMRRVTDTNVSENVIVWALSWVPRAAFMLHNLVCSRVRASFRIAILTLTGLM